MSWKKRVDGWVADFYSLMGLDGPDGPVTKIDEPIHWGEEARIPDSLIEEMFKVVTPEKRPTLD